MQVMEVERPEATSTYATDDEPASTTTSSQIRRDHSVRRGPHRIAAQEYPGAEPAIVLMHGFPDNHHLYDRLLPFLAGRRVVTFDFLGWGESDKPRDYRYTAANQTGDLDAVIADLALDEVVLVAHDASGPPAIDWALAHPDRVAGLVLLNTYYLPMATLRAPEAILLFSTPIVRFIARPISRRFGLFRRLYWWQVGHRFIRDAEARAELVPLLYRQFEGPQHARQAFFGLNADLFGSLRARRAMAPRLLSFSRPVRIIFGDADPYLNAGVARRFHELFPTSDLHLLPGARHFVQVDEPKTVARLIRSMPTASIPHQSEEITP